MRQETKVWKVDCRHTSTAQTSVLIHLHQLLAVPVRTDPAETDAAAHIDDCVGIFKKRSSQSDILLLRADDTEFAPSVICGTELHTTGVKDYAIPVNGDLDGGIVCAWIQGNQS